MTSTDWPITIATADEYVTAGVRLWRQRQQLFATVAVKSTFTLVPGGRMTLRAPLPIERVERAAIQGGGIEPGDLAPCLVQPEIWVRGHAWYPAAEGAPSVRARLILARDSNAIVRKSVEIPVEQGVAPFLHAMAPLSATWPVRTRLLGNAPPITLDHSPLELPDAFDWSYFQAAPADQRFGPLQGDEWIRLEGIHPTIYRFDTRLPSAWSAVVLFGPIEPFRQGVGVRVGLDSIQIDADHGWCALVFRGHIALPPHLPLSELQFVAALGLPDKPIPKLAPKWPDIVPPSRPMQEAAFGSTVMLDATTLQAYQQSPTPHVDEGPSRFPSSIPPSSIPASKSAHTTQQLDQAKLLELAKQPALPFHAPDTETATAHDAPPISSPAPDLSSALPFVHPIPPREVAPPAPTEEKAEPETLGDFFLAAMEELGQSSSENR